MTRLEQVKSRAQEIADRTRKPLVILDFNRAGGGQPVMRDPWPGCEKIYEFVTLVEPA